MSSSKNQSKKNSQNDNNISNDKTYEELKIEMHAELDAKRKIRGDVIYGEVMEYVKLMQHDYERRSKEYWDMFYKSIFCTGVLLIVPYFILTELTIYSQLCFVFPIIAAVISTYCAYNLPMLHDKNLRFDLQFRLLSTYLCKAFEVPQMPILAVSSRYKKNLKNFSITKTASWLFEVLLFLSLLEIVILFDIIFKP
jgi:hypothetical protein